MLGFNDFDPVFNAGAKCIFSENDSMAHLEKDYFVDLLEVVICEDVDLALFVQAMELIKNEDDFEELEEAFLLMGSIAYMEVTECGITVHATIDISATSNLSFAMPVHGEDWIEFAVFYKTDTTVCRGYWSRYDSKDLFLFESPILMVEHLYL